MAAVGFLLRVVVAAFLVFTCRGDQDCVDDDVAGYYKLCISRPGTVKVGDNATLEIRVSPGYENEETNSVLVLNITLEHDLAEYSPQFEIIGNETTLVVLHGILPGRSEISFSCVNESDNTTCPFPEEYMKLVKREVSFARNLPLNVVITVVGWIYFVAWTVSFYLQIFLNFWRRSVAGLNFDFLALNITGFLAYSLFNCGLFWIPEIEREYFHRYPAGVNPVQLNDVVFSLHAFAATAFTIFQCFIFERNKQRISYTAWVILAALWLTIIISLFVAVGGKLLWLDFLYVVSYVKLAVTLLKYIPQAWFNFRRRSTVGWSIGNVLLDFTGGSFSILQMFLISYNYDDWISIFGDPTKFGLGAFSIFFDLIFMFQHYVLFRGRQPFEKRSCTQIDEEADTEKGEKAPLLKDGQATVSIKKGEESIQEPDCGAVSLSKRFMKLLRLS